MNEVYDVRHTKQYASHKNSRINFSFKLFELEFCFIDDVYMIEQSPNQLFVFILIDLREKEMKIYLDIHRELTTLVNH